MFLLKRIPLQNMSLFRHRAFMTVQEYYIRRITRCQTIIILYNGTRGGYQSDNLTRVTAVIVATRHKQYYVLTYEYIKSWKISTRVNASLQVFF